MLFFEKAQRPGLAKKKYWGGILWLTKTWGNLKDFIFQSMTWLKTKYLKSDSCYTHTNPSHGICCGFAFLKKLGSVRFMMKLFNPSSTNEWYMVYNYLHLIHLLHWLFCRRYTIMVHNTLYIGLFSFSVVGNGDLHWDPPKMQTSW